MNTHRWIAVLLTYTVMAAVGQAPLQAQAIVPGDPPLTRDMVDKEIGFWEMLLDIRLSAAQRKLFQDLRASEWKAAKKDWKDSYLKSHQEFRVKTAQLDAAQRSKIRDENQRLVLAQLRVSSHDPVYTFVLLTYDAQILVPGNPALTRGAFEKQTIYWECLLGMQLDAAERREFLQCHIAEWKKMTDSRKRAQLKPIDETYAWLIKTSPAARAAWRVVEQPVFLKQLRASKDVDDRFLVAAYELSRKPGPDTNPILAKGEPPLTLAMVCDYTDLLEWAFDRTNMYGWPIDRLETMQALITEDWEKKDGAGKNAFLADLKWWRETFPKLSDAERRATVKDGLAYTKHIAKTAGEDKQRAQWIQGMVDDNAQEAKLVARLRADGASSSAAPNPIHCKMDHTTQGGRNGFLFHLTGRVDGAKEAPCLIAVFIKNKENKAYKALDKAYSGQGDLCTWAEFTPTNNQYLVTRELFLPYEAMAGQAGAYDVTVQALIWRKGQNKYLGMSRPESTLIFIGPKTGQEARALTAAEKQAKELLYESLRKQQELFDAQLRALRNGAGTPEEFQAAQGRPQTDQRPKTKQRQDDQRGQAAEQARRNEANRRQLQEQQNRNEQQRLQLLEQQRRNDMARTQQWLPPRK